ncbi:MAG: hypothetical protein SPD47_03775 [Oscillospiraceae bacterium]|nr:hypothetical protein [Oscillospiraceae bacterium]
MSFSGAACRSAAAVLSVLFALAAVGCSGNSPVTTEEISASAYTKEEETVEAYNELTLCAAEYWYSGGSVYGEDIRIQITDKEIVYASYFPWEGINNYDGDERDKIVVEHKPIEPAQWADIEKAVDAVLPVLGEGEEYTPVTPSNTGMLTMNDVMALTKEYEAKSSQKGVFQKLISNTFQILDGGDSGGFRLTWRDSGGTETTYSYRRPSDRRFYTLIDVMRETVHPVGREIVWYGEPEVNGVYVTVGKPSSGKDSDFSFSCKPNTSADGEWRFYAYYGENKKPLSCITSVDETIWKRISEKLTELCVEEWKQGKYGSDKLITLYYSDGKSAYFTPDKKGLQELKAFFLDIVNELKTQ